jgi:hypothetical protein
VRVFTSENALVFFTSPPPVCVLAHPTKFSPQKKICIALLSRGVVPSGVRRLLRFSFFRVFERIVVFVVVFKTRTTLTEKVIKVVFFPLFRLLLLERKTTTLRRVMMMRKMVLMMIPLKEGGLKQTTKKKLLKRRQRRRANF